MLQDTENTVLEKGCHWTCFTGPLLVMAAVVTFTLILLDRGVTIPVLPKAALRSLPLAARTVIGWTQLAVAAAFAVTAITALVRRSRIKYVITDERVIRYGSSRESGYLDIPEILSARVETRTTGAKLRRMLGRGDVLMKTREGTHRLKDVADPELFVNTLARVHDGIREAKMNKSHEAIKKAPELPQVPTVKEKKEMSADYRTIDSENPTVRTPDGSDALKTLETLIGLSSVKEEVKSLRNFITVQKMRTDRGLPSTDISLHTVFTGNPGTGKTTVARIMAQIYKETGVLPRGHVIEVDRSGLVAEYVGQTAVKTGNAIDRAIGGVLFIDEAYALTDGGQADYGHEAVTTLIKRMEDDRGRFAVILAGYTNNMTDFMDSNPGLKSRIPRTIHFPDYSAGELTEIFHLLMRKNGYAITAEGETELCAGISRDVRARDRKFGNGRYVRNLFEKTIRRQADRLMTVAEPTEEELKTINKEDICET